MRQEYILMSDMNANEHPNHKDFDNGVFQIYDRKFDKPWKAMLEGSKLYKKGKITWAQVVDLDSLLMEAELLKNIQGEHYWEWHGEEEDFDVVVDSLIMKANCPRDGMFFSEKSLICAAEKNGKLSYKDGRLWITINVSNPDPEAAKVLEDNFWDLV